VLWWQDVSGIPESNGSRFVQGLLLKLGSRIDVLTAPPPLQNTADDWGVERDDVEETVEAVGDEEEEEFVENDPKVR
jgi:hypothetical protein